MMIAELHNRAIELADLGDLSKMKGLRDDALRYYNEAFELERSAAIEARNINIGEPSSSVLLRSAASLGLCCKRLREAEQLIALALSGEPPHEIAEELRNLLETVNFERHLEVNGIALQDGEVQLVVSGSGVGYGFAKGNDVLSRVDAFNNLAVRTIERRLSLPFRKSGPIALNVRKLSQIYLSVPRASSFAVTLRFGKLPEPIATQASLPGIPSLSSTYNDIINDIVQNIALVNQGNSEELEKNFENKTYLNNFVSLVRELAPDGKNISFFGLTYRTNNKVVPVELTRTKEEFKSFPEFDLPDTEDGGDDNFKIDLIKGVLSVADGVKGQVKIKNRTKTVIITVPDGMADIVRTYWEENVEVKYRENLKGAKTIRLLMTIDKTDD